MDFDNNPLMMSFQKYTDKHRDNIPALLCSMWYCGSFCASLMWRHALPELIDHRLAAKAKLRQRLLWITYFWMIEAFFGILACRSVNYTAEELRGGVTSASAIIKLRAFSILRDMGGNAFCIMIAIPWSLEPNPRVLLVASGLLSLVLGRFVGLLSLLVLIYSIRSMICNTRAYQGQEGVDIHYRGFKIASILYLGAFFTE